MGGETNLIVDVEEYKGSASNINTVCQGLDGIMSLLVQHLQSASFSGLEAGQAAENFSSFVSEIARLKGQLNKIGSNINTVITEFLEEIDEADDLLFKNKGYKPFTDEEFRLCFAVVENTVAPEFNLGSWIWTNIIEKLFKFFWKAADYEVTVNTDSSVLVKNVENLKEQTVEKISTIKTGVRSADRIYRQRIKNQLDVLKAYEYVLRQIDSILSPEYGGIDATGLTTLKTILDQYEMFSKTPEVVTDADVKNFSDNVTGYFASSTAVVTAVCASSFGKLVTSDFDEYRATVTAALDYFNSYSSQYTSSYERYEKYKGDFDNMLGFYNKYGSKWVDYYDGDKEKAEMLNKLVSKTGKLSKKSDDYIDVWFQLFCDMSDSKEAFSRFKANCDLDNEQVRKALERVEALYENEVDAFAYETLEKILQEVKNGAIEKGAEAAAKAYSSLFPGGGMEQIITKATSSFLDKAFSEAPAVAHHDWVLATQNSFDNAVAELKAATPGTEGYEELVQTVREAFDNAKQARIKFFTIMAENAEGQHKRFFELNLESTKKMSLDDVTPHQALSLGEFSGENYTILEYLFDCDLVVS